MIGRWKKGRSGVSRTTAQTSAAFEPVTDPVARPLQYPEVPAGSVENLDRALALLMEFTNQSSVAASFIVNPLLSVWDAARDVGTEVSAPVEALLTVAVHRSSIGADEIRGCAMDVRARALQESVLSELVHG